MSAKHRERFRIVQSDQAQANTSMLPAMVSGGLVASSNTSMAGGAGAAARDEWFDQVCSRLTDIDNLQPGWDGYGADKFAKKTVNFAGMLLATVWAEAIALSFPNIGPMSSGAIMIEWRSRTHELTVEVNRANDVDVLIEDLRTGVSTEFHLMSDFAKISDALEQSVPAVRAVA